MISRSKLLRRSTKPIARSGIKRSLKPIPKVNAEATKKRRARNARRMRGVEYQAARAGAMERADGRCEFVIVVFGENETAKWARWDRCPETEKLHFHEEHYARGRILTKDDGKIYCMAHHRYVEKQKPHKQHRSGF